MEIKSYNTDSGDRDLPEKRYENTYTFKQILDIAYEKKAPLIIKTSYFSEEKQGSWYVKGNSDTNYEELKDKIERNLNQNFKPNRICYLIKYFE